jgi:Fe-S oxidoreductase
LHEESGRAWLSKGLVREAKKIINRNISMLFPFINEQSPLIGIEPSAILTFRDEYIDLADEDKFEAAKQLAKNVMTVEEFIAREMDNGAIIKEQFTSQRKEIKLHGHCQQKALSSIQHTLKILSFPENFVATAIPSGCCGMAGSFGYEKEHYQISIKIAELVLFPAIRNQSEDVIIAASGTSCRHQIKDGLSRIAKHPVEILYESMK